MRRSRSAVSARIVYAVGFAGSGVALTLSAGPLVRDLIIGRDAADPEAVVLREAPRATSITWRSYSSSSIRVLPRVFGLT